MSWGHTSTFAEHLMMTVEIHGQAKAQTTANTDLALSHGKVRPTWSAILSMSVLQG
jgi:hypothetical protein